ncbi:unnamed protein product [Gulo gulo]|uniref:Uncharacterized protein n=1 Tax=Gulo gulo TaxID=48420 RepID=A0A9X9Q670_GULGU|nr:unnamed protein product [Gulo gulo]
MDQQQKQELVPTGGINTSRKQFGFGHVKIEVMARHKWK